MTHEEAIKPIDTAIWEMSEAFDGLQDQDLWTRPHPRLLSVGELAAHVAYGEIRWMLPSFESPLNSDAFAYYFYSVEKPIQLELTATELYAEVKRVHEACKAHILESRPELSAVMPIREDWTWGGMLEYMAFHVAYHTGQMYSARHLMGHETNDN
ncbi:MAG: DinB family protein [Armatimonadetes bacterium]|nr:DinB family protein [Armatimonadota bacterium]